MVLQHASSVKPEAQQDKGRGFRTDFESHKNLLHKFARMLMGRMQGAGLNPDYDDIFGEMCEAYACALPHYNPEKGITFSAYLGRVVWNNVNRRVDHLLEEHKAIGHVPLSDFAAESGEDDDSILGRLSDDAVQQSPEDIAERNEAMARRMRNLPALVRAVIRELVSPSPELMRTYEAMKAHREFAMTIHRRPKKVPNEVTLSVIYQHFGLSPDQISTVEQQCLEHLGVDLRAS